MEILHLIKKLNKLNIGISLHGEDLELDFDGDHLPESLLGEIKAQKQSLVSFLKSRTDGITPAEPSPDNSYPLSSSQLRLWMLSQLDNASLAYNLPGYYVIEGALDTAALSFSFNTLIRRHEILRTVFSENEPGVVRQVILDAGSTDFQIAHRDCRSLHPDEVDMILEQEYYLPFDLSAGPLLRASLYRVGADRWILAYTMHHIISDGWSMVLLLSELLSFYQSFTRGETPILPPLSIQYKDYAQWQIARQGSRKLDADKAWWLEYLSGTLPVADLPADLPRPGARTFRGATAVGNFDASTTTAFKEFLKREGATLYMGLFAAVNILLHRLTGQMEFVIGCPVAGRETLDLENQIGFYINTLPLRTRLAPQDSFLTILQRVKAITIGGFEHQQYPLEALLENLNLQTDPSRNPLFDVIVVLQNNQGAELQEKTDLGSIRVNKHPWNENPTSKLDWLFSFEEIAGELEIKLEYNTGIYEQHTAVRTLTLLKNLVLSLLESPAAAIATVDILNPAQRRQLLVDFNDTAAPFPEDKTIPALIREASASHPDNIAVVFEQRTLTYRELAARADRLARHLRQKGVSPETLVPICVERGAEMIVGILAVLNAGGAYVPIDPAYPAERIRYILQDTAASLVLCTATTKSLLPDGAAEVIDVGAEGYSADGRDDSPLPAPPQPGNPAYVIYTSGSTGRPKGVMIEHRSLVNRLHWAMNHFAVTSRDAILQKTNYCFDVSVWELLLPLMTGAKLVLARPGGQLDSEYIKETIRRQDVTMLHFVPAMFNVFLAGLETGDCRGLRHVVCSGEALSAAQVELCRQKLPGAVLSNLYGPTEAAIDVSYWTPPASREPVRIVPIGKPINNIQLHILDDRLQLVPIGVKGEIFIAGIGLAREYRNLPALTAEKFPPNPFVAGERIYHTGDIGRWLPDGNIEYLGRSDHQVKVRGFRIELGEIEQALRIHPRVKDAIVVALEKTIGEKELAAYLVGDGDLSLSELRSHLAKSLPAYMIPDHFVQLEQLPLTSNGKVDRKALPDPYLQGLAAGSPNQTPASATETRMATIWRELVGDKRIGVRDNFFDLGGHSLKAMQLAGRLYKEFGVKVTLKDIFAHPILEDQCRLIDATLGSGFVNIPCAPARSSYPLSSAQRRLWVLNRFDGGNVAYNIPEFFTIEGPLDLPAFRNSFNTLIGRHEILRTVFREDETGQVRQFILSPEACRPDIALRTLDTAGDRQEQIGKILGTELSTPFDLGSGPLLRVHLYKLSPEKHLLVFTLHHIICDGWSMDLLLKELQLAYPAWRQGMPPILPAPRIQYKDYAEWQDYRLTHGALDADKAWWLRLFQEPVPTLELAHSTSRPAVRTFQGSSIRHRIDRQTRDLLTAMARHRDSSLFAGLIAVINTLLYHYSGNEDIVVGTPVAGRDHPDLEDQIGFYVNMLPLRTRFSGAGSFTSLLDETQKVILEGYEHASYPFDQLVNALELRRDTGRNPLFDVLIDFREATSASAGSMDFALHPYPVDRKVSKFDLTFFFTDRDEGLILELEYNTDLFSSDYIRRMIGHFSRLLTAITASPETAVGNLSCLPYEEEHLLRVTFNDTHTSLPVEKTVVHLFEKQASSGEGRVALQFGQAALTYGELHRQSKKLAGHLQTKWAIGPGDTVVIMLDRSENLPIAIWAILMAGGAYVPVDPAYAEKRKAFIIEDTAPKLLITQADLIFDLPWYDGPVFAIDVQLPTIDSAADIPLPAPSPDDPAYVLYTSGSTGKPKGVTITHKALFNYVVWANGYYFREMTPVMPLFTTVSFDLTVTSFFCPLTLGGKMIIFKQTEDLAALLKDIFSADHDIDAIKLTPSHLAILRQLDLQAPGVRLAILGGEAVSQAHVEVLKRVNPAIRIFNEYGPTETTVGCTVAELGPGIPVSIGRPIANTQVYILNNELSLRPVGIKGEICIGGTGLADGYWNNPGLTAGRFVAGPFGGHQRLYRTGDIGRWLPDGNIEYLGRGDHQVKMRGFRIEPGEIEQTLRSHPGIKDTAVIARDGNDASKYLVAYWVGDETLDAAALRSWLSNSLPAYMLPEQFVPLPSLPLTANGKMDRKALPDPDGREHMATSAYLAPRNETEEKLVRVWQDVLERSPVGIQDDFFRLGGDSIKVIRLINQIRMETGLEISVTDIYRYCTIGNLMAAGLGDNSVTGGRSATESPDTHRVSSELAALKDRILATGHLPSPGNIEDLYPASDIEKGMIYEGLLDQASGVYHDQKLFHRTFEHFSMDVFNQALGLLTDKHAILRTSFNLYDFEREVQIVHRRVSPDTGYEDLTGLQPAEQKDRLAAFLLAERRKPFFPDKAPLWRMNVFRTEPDHYWYVFQCHHAIIDGWSEMSFITELNNLYLILQKDPSVVPEKLRSSYKDFVIRQEAAKGSDAIRDFWQKELDGSRPVEIFTDEWQSSAHITALTKPQLRQLEKLAPEMGTTVKIVSFATHLLLMAYLGGVSDVTTGLVTNTRPACPDGDRILGCFLNTIPFRITVDPAETGADFVRRVGEKLILLKDYEGIGLAGTRKMDTFFNYVDFHILDALIGAGTEPDRGTHPFGGLSSHALTNMGLDLTVNGSLEGYSLQLQARKKLKRALSLEEVGSLFFDILHHLTTGRAQPIGNRIMIESPVRQIPRPAIGAIILAAQKEYVAPRNEMEEKLAGIWQQLVGNRPIGMNDDFFELGGHSLKMMRLSGLLKKEFGVHIELDKLFRHPTVGEMANLIRSVEGYSVPEDPAGYTAMKI